MLGRGVLFLVLVVVLAAIGQAAKDYYSVRI
jgi:hypothetical protein